MAVKANVVNLVAKFQVTLNGQTLKLTSTDMQKLVAAHEKAMARTVVKAKADEAKRRKAELVAKKVLAAKAAVADAKANAPQVTRVTKRNQVLVEVKVPVAKNATERRALELVGKKAAADKAWAVAYTNAFNAALGQRPIIRGDADQIARNNAALSADPAVKLAAVEQAKAVKALDSVIKGSGLTYRELAAKMAA